MDNDKEAWLPAYNSTRVEWKADGSVWYIDSNRITVLVFGY